MSGRPLTGRPAQPWRPASATARPAATAGRAAGGGTAVVELPERRREATSPLGREILYTLRQAQNLLALLGTRAARAESDPMLLLRAARACWLIDDLDAMCVYYREAATQLQEAVELYGRRTGTAPEFWRLALGALWMAATYSEEGKERNTDQGALRTLAYQIVDTGGRMVLDAAQPLDRIALEIARLRGAWLMNDLEFPRMLSTVEQRVSAMDVNNRGLWVGERDQLSLAAIRAVTRERPERMGATLTQLDEFLWSNATRPPTVMDLMDEEMLALEAAALKAGARPGSLRMAPKRGARRADVGGR